MKGIVLALVALVTLAGPAHGQRDRMVYRTGAQADVALPFWCDWGYDWEERCYRDFSDRLSIGGEADKVWRSASRFPLSGIPAGSFVLTATLSLSFDGVCVGPRKTEQPCPARSYTIDVHPIFGADWFRERELEFGDLVDRASFSAATWPQRLFWDVTDAVTGWVGRGVSNDGLLLKLADGHEEFNVTGPKLPSSEFPTTTLRPALEVTYFPP